MWAFWVLFWLSFVMDSCAIKVDYMQLKYGVQLSFKLSKEAESLEFSSVGDKEPNIIWPSSGKHKRGQVTGWGNDKRFVMNSVTFDDQGNYTQKNFRRKVVAIVKVKVSPSVLETDCVAGETLKISLKGLTSDQATLRFNSQDFNFTLVDHGLPVGIGDYYERLKVTIDAIQVLNVNVSDVGKYELRDHRGRTVSIVNMRLVDHHQKNWSPLVALMLLLGIPAGVCCCCRNRIFKKSNPSTSMTIMQARNLIPPPGPPPSYNTVVVPGVPDSVIPSPNPALAPQPYYGGQPAMPPNPGVSSQYSHENPPATPGYPPAAPGYPPTAPGYPAAPGYPPAAPGYPPPAPGYPAAPGYPPTTAGYPAQQAPWSATSYNPPAPTGMAPAMSYAPAGPASATGEIKMNETSSATPLLTPSQPEVRQPGVDILNSDSAVQFNINVEKNSAPNFL